MFQAHRSIQSHELFAFVVAPISNRIAQAFSESHQPCCCLPCERVRVCFCESQLDINHFTRRGASHAAHPRPSKTLERKKESPVNGEAAALSFPLVRLLHLITCFGDGPSQPGSRCRNTTGARAGPTGGISHQRLLMFPLDAVDKVQRWYPR